MYITRRGFPGYLHGRVTNDPRCRCSYRCCLISLITDTLFFEGRLYFPRQSNELVNRSRVAALVLHCCFVQRLIGRMQIDRDQLFRSRYVSRCSRCISLPETTKPRVCLLSLPVVNTYMHAYIRERSSPRANRPDEKRWLVNSQEEYRPRLRCRLISASRKSDYRLRPIVGPSFITHAPRPSNG